MIISKSVLINSFNWYKQDAKVSFTAQIAINLFVFKSVITYEKLQHYHFSVSVCSEEARGIKCHFLNLTHNKSSTLRINVNCNVGSVFMWKAAQTSMTLLLILVFDWLKFADSGCWMMLATGFIHGHNNLLGVATT